MGISGNAEGKSNGARLSNAISIGPNWLDGRMPERVFAGGQIWLRMVAC